MPVTGLANNYIGKVPCHRLILTMFSFRALLLLFILVPFVEIYVLIEVGSRIGAPWTIALVVLTAAIGAALVRRQGLATLSRVQASLDAGTLPAVELVEGAFLLVAGVLLLMPGFVTDAVGVTLLTPPARRALVQRLLARGVIRAAGTRPRSGGSGSGRGDTLEGEYRRVDDG